MKMDNKDSFDESLLDIIVCPVTKEKLILDKKNNELLSKRPVSFSYKRWYSYFTDRKG